MFNLWEIATESCEVADQKGIQAGFNYVREMFRSWDESHLYPINGKFNATERAIRHLRKAIRNGLVIDSPLEYALELDNTISIIVNNEC